MYAAFFIVANLFFLFNFHDHIEDIHCFLLHRLSGLTFQTSDGIEFSIVTNDVIELTESQFNDIVMRIVRWKVGKSNQR